MKKHISFPSIEQFRNIVATINRRYSFAGLDEHGEAIYNYDLAKPKLTFKGTVKLHGTNAGVCYNNIDGLWVQSRENIITSQSDNAGFAFFVESNDHLFMNIINKVANRSCIDLNNNTISVYGEWAGGNIQKGVGITNIAKSFFIFGVKVSPFPIEGEEKPPVAYWIDYTDLRDKDARIYNIDDYPTYEIEIDFNTPETVQNKLSELTLAVEEKCPVADAFGFEGVGEGVVWSCEHDGVVHRFKVKGEKYSSSKVKTLAAVDVEKIASIREFVDYAVTDSRFNQGIEKTFPNNGPIDIKKLGQLIKWITDDVTKEEMDTMKQNNLEPKDVNKYISTKVREMFMKLPINQF